MPAAFEAGPLSPRRRQSGPWQRRGGKQKAGGSCSASGGLTSEAGAEDEGKPAQLAREVDAWARAEALVRLVAALVLHFAWVLGHAGTLAVFGLMGQGDFFGSLLVVWLVAGLFCAWTAWLEGDHLGAGRPVRSVRSWLYLILFCGLLRGVAVQRFVGTYRQRLRAQHARQPEEESHPSTISHSLLECFPFALLSLLAFAMLPARGCDLPCQWFLTEAFQERRRLRWVLLGSGLCSTMLLALGIYEVDTRVSARVQRRVEKSALLAAAHFTFRAAQAGYRLLMIVVLSLFLRTLPWLSTCPGPLLLVPPVAALWLTYMCLLSISGLKEHFFAHALVAAAAVVVNPALMVERPSYIRDARRVSAAIHKLRWLEFLIAAVVMAVTWNGTLPAGCLAAARAAGLPETVGAHILRCHPEVPALLAGAVALHGVFYGGLVAVTVSELLAGDVPLGPLVDDRMLRLSALPGADRGVLARRKAPRGLSSCILQVGFGLRSELLFAEDAEEGGRGSFSGTTWSGSSWAQAPTGPSSGCTSCAAGREGAPRSCRTANRTFLP